jgi:hypothetical protein
LVRRTSHRIGGILPKSGKVLPNFFVDFFILPIINCYQDLGLPFVSLVNLTT